MTTDEADAWARARAINTTIRRLKLILALDADTHRDAYAALLEAQRYARAAVADLRAAGLDDSTPNP